MAQISLMGNQTLRIMKTDFGDGNDVAVDPEMDLPGGHDPLVCHPIMDEEDARVDEFDRGYKLGSRVGLAHIQDVLLACNSFKGNGHFAVRCAMAAHGMWSALRERDQVEIASFFQCERANVNKLVKQIQKRLGLPPTLGQRSMDGCENMSERRKGQLLPAKHAKGR